MSPNFTLECSTFECKDEQATLACAEKFALCLQPGLVIHLQGDLGVGKTTFARGLIHALGHTGKVKSPTYALVENYPLVKFNIYHFDLYRFIDKEEWEAAGFRDYFNQNNICLIEWPEKAAYLCPNSDIGIKISHQSQGRSMAFTAHTQFGTICLEHFLAAFV